MAGGLPATCALAEEAKPPAVELKAPHRVWFQPRLFHRDMSLYAGMTIDASGWLDPKLAALAGKTALRWTYGTNHPDAVGPEYWRKEIADQVHRSPHRSGVALDEWVPSTNPAMEGWVAEGLRQGRKAAPEQFIAVWVTDPTATLAKLVDDGIVDLVIAETYTHAAARYGPDSFLHWETALRRMDAAQALGMGDKTIFCFGHITLLPDTKGRKLDLALLAERAHQIKERYPKAPGIAFYQDDSTDDSRDFRNMIRKCDELSTKLWPSTP
jgi:hypothetical protein